MLATINSLANTENTHMSQENKNNISCVPMTVSQYLIAEGCNYSIQDPDLQNPDLASWSVVNIEDNNSIIGYHNEYSTTPDTNYEAIVNKAQAELEDALFAKDQTITKQTIFSLINNQMYPLLFIDILNNLLIQNKATYLKTLFFDHTIYNENILNYLLQDQLNSEQNIDLIKQLATAGASVTIEYIELLLNLSDKNFINQQLNLLYCSNLLHNVLNEAVDQDRLDTATNIYYIHNFCTIKLLNYLLEDLFTNKFDLISFKRLIYDGATIKTSTMQRLIASEDTNKINNILTLLTNHSLFYTTLTFMLAASFKQKNISIEQMLRKSYRISSNSLLLNSLQDITNIDFINRLITLGASITKDKIYKVLTKYSQELNDSHFFLDLYLQIKQINFNKEIKKTIKRFLICELEKTRNIKIAATASNIIRLLYDKHSFYTIKSLNYLLESLFINKFNLKLFDKLIDDGATVQTSTLQKLVASESTNEIKNIITLLDNNKRSKELLTSILNIAIDQNKISIVKMLNKYYNIYTTTFLNYLLLNSLQDITNIDVINELIEFGATITNKEICEFLTVYTQQLTDNQFLDFYLKLEQINFSKENKEDIKFFWQRRLKQKYHIAVSGNTLNIVRSLYLEHGFITQTSLNYILTYETSSEVRYSAEILFEQKYKYKSTLEDIANNL
jgi:hypothetical protein